MSMAARIFTRAAGSPHGQAWGGYLTSALAQRGRSSVRCSTDAIICPCDSGGDCYVVINSHSTLYLFPG